MNFNDLPQLKRSEIPNWIKDEAAEVFYRQRNHWRSSINDLEHESPILINLLNDAQRSNVIENLEILKNCLTNRMLKRQWIKIGNIYSNDESKSQAFLAHCISESLPVSRYNYLPKISADKWKKSTLKALNEVEELMKNAPANFNSWQKMYKRQRFIDFNLGGPETGHYAPSVSRQNLIEMINNDIESPVAALNIIKKSLMKTASEASYFKNHTTGIQAKRTFFVRKLSSMLEAKTFKKNRNTVAEIASLAFNINSSLSPLTMQDVSRMAKDAPAYDFKDEDFDAYFDAVLRPNPFFP